MNLPFRHCEECNDLGGSHAADSDMAIQEDRGHGSPRYARDDENRF